jgi:hypothetical protein
VLVCDSRKNALLQSGNKNDRVDARKLAELLYLNKLNPVYHGKQESALLKATSSLSAWSRTLPSPDSLLAGGLTVLPALWFEGEYP